jgi:hypothetical protein
MISKTSGAASLPFTTAEAIITPLATVASTDSLDCDTPSSFDPLLGLLDSLVELAFLAGIGLGTLGFLVAGLFLMLPGQDNSRRGKLVAKNVFIGAVLLLSAQLIVDFLVSQLGATLCT